MKSKDNKSTLFQYIIEFIMEDYDRKLLNFMPYFELFTKMQITLIQESYNSLKDKFKSVEALKRMLNKLISIILISFLLYTKFIKSFI